MVGCTIIPGLAWASGRPRRGCSSGDQECSSCPPCFHGILAFSLFILFLGALGLGCFACRLSLLWRAGATLQLQCSGFSLLSGFSCCKTHGLQGEQASVVCGPWAQLFYGTWDHSGLRDEIHVPYIAWQILNLWTTRKVLHFLSGSDSKHVKSQRSLGYKSLLSQHPERMLPSGDGPGLLEESGSGHLFGHLLQDSITTSLL